MDRRLNSGSGRVFGSVVMALLLLLTGCDQAKTEHPSSKAQDQETDSQKPDAGIRETETVTLFRFTDELDIGRKIEASVLEAIKIPIEYKDAFGNDAIREDPGKPGLPIDGLGYLIQERVVKGEVLRAGHIINKRPQRYGHQLNLDEITLSIDAKQQPPNLSPGDFIDIYASVPLNRSTEFMRVMECVEVVGLGERIQDSGKGARANKYSAITIYVDPMLSSKLFDIQHRVKGQTFSVTRRDPSDRIPRELKTGGSKEINGRVLEILNLE